jgi:hypothetical protein
VVESINCRAVHNAPICQLVFKTGKPSTGQTLHTAALILDLSLPTPTSNPSNPADLVRPTHTAAELRIHLTTHSAMGAPSTSRSPRFDYRVVDNALICQLAFETEKSLTG